MISPDMANGSETYFNSARTLVGLVEHGGGAEVIFDDLFRGDAPTDVLQAEFFRIVDIAKEMAGVERRTVENATDTDILLAVEAQVNKKTENAVNVVGEPPADHRPAQWPTRLKRQAVDSAFPSKEAEDRKRCLWLGKAG